MSVVVSSVTRTFFPCEVETFPLAQAICRPHIWARDSTNIDRCPL